MANISEKLGANIRRIREGKELSQSDLCKKLKVDRAYVSNLEGGKSNPTLQTLERLAKALGVSISELLQ